MSEAREAAMGHDHGPAVVECEGCGQERWCGSGPCSNCGCYTECLVQGYLS